MNFKQIQVSNKRTGSYAHGKRKYLIIKPKPSDTERLAGYFLTYGIIK